MDKGLRELRDPFFSLHFSFVAHSWHTFFRDFLFFYCTSCKLLHLHVECYNEANHGDNPKKNQSSRKKVLSCTDKVEGLYTRTASFTRLTDEKKWVASVESSICLSHHLVKYQIF